jgi:hypothetical protein
VGSALTAYAVEKPVHWYIGGRHPSELDPLRFVSEYTHVHATLTQNSMNFNLFGFSYQQLFAYPPAEIDKVRSVIDFKSPQITNNHVGAVTRLGFANKTTIKCWKIRESPFPSAFRLTV